MISAGSRFRSNFSSQKQPPDSVRDVQRDQFQDIEPHAPKVDGSNPSGCKKKEKEERRRSLQKGGEGRRDKSFATPLQGGKSVASYDSALFLQITLRAAANLAAVLVLQGNRFLKMR
jgi:hypothetical protein